MARMKPDISSSDRLRLAAGKGDLKIVCDLLDQGVHPDKDKDGRTLLHIAAQNGRVDVTKNLVARGFDVRAQDTLGYTPLHRASAQGHLEVIEFLVKNNCSIDQQDECGNTALHAAAWNGYSQTIDLLLRNKARVNTVNKAGFTALHSAAQKGHNQSARVLLFAGCQLNLKNKYGETALHTSARHGHAGVARILLSAKCKVDVQNKNGETALHVAVMFKRQKIAKLVIEAGVKKKLKNKQGETALEIARKMNDLEMILVLTSEEKAPVIRRHRSEDIRQLSPADDTNCDAKSDASTKRRDSQSRQEIVKDNYQTLGSCTAAGPAAAGAMATKTSCVAAPSNTTAASNRLFFDSNMTPKKLLDGFKQHQLEKQTLDKIAPTKEGKKEKKVIGLLSEYVPKPGQVYFRDLSGKVKQGPVGYASVYEGGPALQQPERKNAADHNNVYERITSAKDLEKTKKHCQRRISNQPVTEQGQSAQGQSAQGRNNGATLSRLQKSTLPVEGHRSRIQSEPRLHSRSRSTNLEHRFRGQPVQEDPCDCCRSNAAIQTTVEGIGVVPDLDAYGFIQSGYLQDVGGHVAENRTPQGRLFRSRSDETLSTRSAYRRRRPSRQHLKTKAPNVDTSGDRYWTMSKVTSTAREVDRDRTYQTLHGRQPKVSKVHRDRRPRTYHEECDYVLPSALPADCTEHISHGFVAPDNTPQNQPPSLKLASTARQQVRGTYRDSSEAFLGSEERLDSSEIFVASRRRLTCSDIPSTSKPGLPLSRSGPFAAKGQMSVMADVSQSSSYASPLPDEGPCHQNTPAASLVCAAYPQENCCSLQSAISQARADSVSNPDSGYGSKIYGTRGDLVMSLRPQDSNSSGKESRQSREDDKNSLGSSHWNTSECTVAPRHPVPEILTKPVECGPTQPVRKTTTERQRSLKENARPFHFHSANSESLKPKLPQELHQISSENTLITGRSHTSIASWNSRPQERSQCRLENRFSPNEFHYRQQAETYDLQGHLDNRDRITGSTAQSSSLNQPAKLSKRHDRPTSYQPYEATASRQNGRPDDRSIQQNNSVRPDDRSIQQNNSVRPDDRSVQQNNSVRPDDRSIQQNNSVRPDDRSIQQNNSVRLCDQSDGTKYGQPHASARNGQETSECSDFHVSQTDRRNTTEQCNDEFHWTESFQDQVCLSLEPTSVPHVELHALKQPPNRVSRMEIGRSTMV